MDSPNEVIETQTPSMDEPWIAVARSAAFALAGYSLVFQVLAGFAAPVTVIGLVFLGLGIAIRSGRRKLAFTSGLLALLLVVGSAAPLADALTDLASLEAFALNLFLTLVCLVAFAAGIGSIRRSTGRLLRPAVWASASLFLVGLVVSVIVAAGVESAEPMAGDARVVAEALAFEPEVLVVSAGSGLWLENRDGVRHTFTVEGTAIELNVPGHSSGRIELDLEPGTYRVICDVPGHGAMSVDLTIKEAQL
ncbi:MAG: cupredoxin domain-containing protein [Acidimicrobiia bacterium]|nr:cupredoxin domain-containing protein [Acidimicrobiia bacterium]